jgi:hypothetical protein
VQVYVSTGKGIAERQNQRKEKWFSINSKLSEAVNVCSVNEGPVK